jgi:hypothetical protein
MMLSLALLALSCVLTLSSMAWSRWAKKPVALRMIRLWCLAAMTPAGASLGLAFEMLERRWRIGMGLGVAALFGAMLFELLRRLRPHHQLLDLVWLQHGSDDLALGEVHAEDDSDAFNPRPVIWDGQGQFCNLHILGAVGSGKTASTILPLAEQIFAKYPGDAAKKPGAVFLDIKGGMAQKLSAIAKRYGRQDDIVILRPGGVETINLIGDAEPQVAAQRLNDALFASDNGQSHPFYRESQLAYLRGAFTALDARFGRGNYTLEDLYRFVSDDEVFEDVMAQLGGADDATDLEAARYLERIMATLKPGERRKLTLGLTNSLSLWVTGVFKQTFSPIAPSFPGFRALINDGLIVVIELPEDEFNAALCRSVALVLLSGFMDTALGRTNHVANPDLNRERLVYLFVDEAHTVMSKQFERFTAVSRQARTPVIIAHQTIGQIHPDFRNGIAGNFRSHLVLSINDAETADFFEAHFGQALTQRVSKSRGRSRGGMRGSHYSQGESTTQVSEARFSSTALRELPQWTAVASIYDGSRRRPPVRLRTFPHFLHVTEGQ